jgi:CHAD domain-containing protein
MEFELAADADDVALLARLKPLTACRDGRPRAQAVKIVWQDTPDHALLTDGLTLAEQRGAWRLERLAPGTETWLPAQPPPVLSESPDLATLPAPLAPLAAFEGRRTVSLHRIAETPLTLTVEKGTLRAVSATRPVARIGLSGADTAVHAAALLIADAIPVSVPAASLAAEAAALAIGHAPQPRRHGAPVLPPDVRTVPEALAHILGHLTDVILAYAPQAARPGGGGPEAVHQMRVAVRRARSAIAIFRPALARGALDAVNDGLKALGARLGPTRDWDVFTEETIPAIQHAMPGDERLAKLAVAAARRQREHQKDLAQYLDSAEFRLLGITLAWFIAAQAWQARPESEPGATPGDLVAFADTVLQHRWKKLLSAGKRIGTLDIGALHALRLRAKRARYAAEMFAALHDGKAAHRFISRLSVLQQRLGVLNDGAVASHLLLELGGAGGRHAYATGLIAGFLAARAERIRPRIIKAYERFRRQDAYWA